jgi:hypothetical protein
MNKPYFTVSEEYGEDGVDHNYLDHGQNQTFLDAIDYIKNQSSMNRFFIDLKMPDGSLQNIWKGFVNTFESDFDDVIVLELIAA